MKTSFELIAEFREDQGKGASRRLRHAGRVPAILYGGAREPRSLALDHNKVSLALDNERFYSTIITLKVGEVTFLQIDQHDPSMVDVLIRVDNGAPVKTNTQARLETRGFTGVADVLLVGGTPGAPELKAGPDQVYPQIRAERSDMQNLLGNAQQLSTKAAELLLKLDKFLDQNSFNGSGVQDVSAGFQHVLAINRKGQLF